MERGGRPSNDTATLPVRDETVAFLTDLLTVERLRRGTRTDTRAL